MGLAYNAAKRDPQLLKAFRDPAILPLCWQVMETVAPAAAAEKKGKVSVPCVGGVEDVRIRFSWI